MTRSPLDDTLIYYHICLSVFLILLYLGYEKLGCIYTLSMLSPMQARVARCPDRSRT
jgi:hypothetical protein